MLDWGGLTQEVTTRIRPPKAHEVRRRGLLGRSKFGFIAGGLARIRR
jgi:hypothetical protein